MNDKNNWSGVKTLGSLLVFSGLVSISFDYLFPAKRHTPSSLLLMDLFSSLAIFPKGAPWLLHYFPQLFVNIGVTFILAWRICIILCGLGVFFFKNIGRIILIVFSIIHITTFVFSSLLMAVSQPAVTNHLSDNMIIDALIKINANVFVWLLPLVYSVYLILPKVRTQFK